MIRSKYKNQCVTPSAAMDIFKISMGKNYFLTWRIAQIPSQSLSHTHTHSCTVLVWHPPANITTFFWLWQRVHLNMLLKIIVGIWRAEAFKSPIIFFLFFFFLLLLKSISKILAFSYSPVLVLTFSAREERNEQRCLIYFICLMSISMSMW